MHFIPKFRKKLEFVDICPLVTSAINVFILKILLILGYC